MSERARVGAGFALDAVLVLAALAVATFRPSGAWLENAYINDIYAHLQQNITGLTDASHFCAADLVLLAVFGGVIAAWIVHMRRRRSWRAASQMLGHTFAVASVLYMWFMVAWGWNYERPALYLGLHYDARAVRALSVDRIEEELVHALARAVGNAHATHDRSPDFEDSLRLQFASVLPDVGIAFAPHVPHPKRSLILDPYFAATGITGMFFPYTYETLLTSDVLWYEQPFTLAHEWAHHAGIARESDANFIGAISTLRSDDPLAHYSGLLEVYAALPRIAAHDKRLDARVLADYTAMRTRDARHIKPIAFKFAWGTYDRYLKSNHVESGIVNYTEYVQLILGTSLGRSTLGRAIGDRSLR